MEIKEEYLILFELACADLKLVEKNLGDKDIRQQILLFHLQQATEKFLKSLLSLHHVKFPKIHDIEKLIEVCEEKNITLPGYIEKVINLTPFAVEYRYGFIIEEKLNIHDYYKKTLKLKKFVEKVLASKNPENSSNICIKKKVK